MNTVFSRQIQKLRKQKGITQEQLAAKLGVTAQAVSKWENGSYPDGDLLPKIADIFDVSIDNLYGRGEEKCSFEQQVVNHMQAIADSNQDSCAEWLKSYLNIIWAMQLTAWRECRYYYDIPDFKDSNGTIASECTCNTGVTYMRLNKDFRYFTYIEQPESFAKQFSDIDKLSELFRFLGDKMNLKVVMYLLSLDNGEVAGASTIATHLGYPKEKIEKALRYLLSINGSNKEIIEISVLCADNGKEKVYGVRNYLPEMLILLTGAFAVLNQPHGYSTNVNNRDYPFFDRKDMSFIKVGEKNEKNKEKEKNTNPYHKEYGVFSNSIHALKSMLDYSHRFIPVIIIGVVCAPIMQYLWSFISKFVIDMINDNRQVSALILLMAGFAVIQILSTMLNSFYKSKYYLYIGARFRQIKLKNRKIMSVNYECLEDKDIMDCYQKANNACNSNNVGVEGMMRSIVNLIMIIPIIVTGIVILGTMNIFIVIAMIICAVVQFFISNRTNKKAKEKVWDPLAPWWRKHNYLVYTTSDFSAAKDIRMFGLREWLTDKFKALNKERYEAQKMNSKIWLFASIANTVIWTVIQAAVYAWLILSVVNGNMSIGNFTLYLASSMTFFEYINNLLNAVSDLFAKSREYDDFRSFMDIDGGENNSVGKEVPVLSQYEFTFRNVSFKYPKAENYALRNVNLTLKAGERLAVVGLNGAGKSTFIKLLMRLYEPTEGEILLNGVNIKEYNKNSYYSIFSPAFQEVNLFAFPLFMNVSMLPEDNTDKQKAEQCVIASGLEEKLKELDKGIDNEMLKVIYDDGTDLSGGEKQKLALARALYKNAPVVVLDEPTAALDALAESKLYGDFDKFIGNKTAVYISHRLSSTQFCDKVAMFKDGSIIEYGTHSELMKMGGEYSNMFSVQAQYYIDSREEVTADA